MATEKKKKTESLKYYNDNKPTLWYIEWLDHCTHAAAGWKEWDDRPGLSTILCIGWVTYEDEGSVYVVNNLDPKDGQHLHGQHIVKSCIVRSFPVDLDWEN